MQCQDGAGKGAGKGPRWLGGSAGLCSRFNQRWLAQSEALRSPRIRNPPSAELRSASAEVAAPPSLNTFATRECLEVSRAVDHPKNLHSVRAGAVEYEHPFEARHSKNSQGCYTRVLKAAMPSHLRLCGEERKRLVGGAEAVACPSVIPAISNTPLTACCQFVGTSPPGYGMCAIKRLTGILLDTKDNLC